MATYPSSAANLPRTIAFGMCRGVSFSVEPFLHGRFGVRYILVCGPFAVVSLMIFAMFIPPEKAGPFVLFMAAFVACSVLAQIGAWIRFRQGDNEHSLYNGFPRCLRSSVGHREYKVKQFFEPMLVLFLGYVVLDWNAYLGAYWIVAAACLFLTNAIGRRRDTREALLLHDAVLDQQHRAQRFKEIQGLRA
jgi:hypothetical protein